MFIVLVVSTLLQKISFRIIKIYKNETNMFPRTPKGMIIL
jgi:hypothetical protein